MENIDIRVHVASNLGKASAEALAFQKAISKAANDVQKAQTLFNMGKIDATDFSEVTQGVRSYRQGIIDAATASGKYNVAQKTMTAETTRFNEKLMRSKVAFRDVFGPQNRRMIREAANEQMRLNKMQAVVWGTDALGKQHATLFTPKYLDNIGNARLRMGYYNEILHSVSQQTVNWGKNMQWTGRQLTVGFTVPVAMAIGALAKLGFDMDKGITRIVKVYGDGGDAMNATSESIANMAVESAEQIAAAYGMAGTEVLDVMSELAATGMEGQDLARMTAETARASMLGDMSADDTLMMLRTLREAYGLTTNELKSQIDMFNAVENATSLTMQDIAEGMPRIAGIMQGVGVTIEDSTVLLTAFKAAGIDVAEGANALKSIAFKAIAPTPTAESNFFSLTGRSLKQIVETAEGEFLPVMTQISHAMRQLDQDAKVDLIARVFGIHQGSRAITLLDQLTSGSEQMIRAQQVVGQDSAEWAAAARKEIEALQESVSGRLTRAWQAMVVVFQKAGMLALEMVVPLIEGIGKIVDAFDNLPDAAKNIGMVVASLLAIAGPIIMLIGLSANFIGMAGRLGAQIGRLALRFNMLDAESAAARAMFNALGTETVEYAQSLAAADKQIVKQAQSMGILTDKMKKYNQEMRMRDARGRFIKNHGEDLPQEFWDRQAIRESEKSHRTIAEQAEITRKRWAKISGAMIGGSTALLGIGMLTDNEGINELAMKLMTISMLMPVISAGFIHFKSVASAVLPRVAKELAVLASPITFFTGEKLGDTMKRGFEKGVSGAKSAMKGFANFMMGPGGMAVGAIIAGYAIAWQKHRQEIEETRKVYEGLNNAVKDLGDVYNYTFSTPLERQRAGKSYDPDSNTAARARIETLRQEKAQYVENLEAFGRLNTDTSAQLTEALRQGQAVLQQGGSVEDAMRAARDAYQLVSGYFYSMPAFRQELEVELGVNADQIYAEGHTAGIIYARGLSDAVEEMMNSDSFWWGNDVTADQEERLEGIYRNIYVTAMDMPFIERKKFLEQALAEELSSYGGYLSGFREMTGDNTDTITEMWRTVEAELGGDAFGHRNPEFFRELQEYTGMTIHEAEVFISKLNSLGQEFPELDLTNVLNVPDLLNQLSGFDDELSKYVDFTKLEEQFDNDLLQANFSERIKITADYYRERDRMLKGGRKALEQEAYWSRYMASDNYADRLKEIEENAAKAAEAVAELSDEQRNMMQAHRGAAEWAAGELKDFYMDQIKAQQDAADARLQAEGDALIASIEAEHDATEKAKDALHKSEVKALRKEHDRQMDAVDAYSESLDEQVEAREKFLSKQLENRQKALEAELKRFQKDAEARKEAEKKAFDDRWEGIDDRNDEAQEARRERIENSYDMQIEKINETIERERELEEQRQRIFEKEKERIQRLSELYNRNIDMNVAINTGDLDEAARIGNEMSSLRATWAQDDAGQASESMLERRERELEEQIELLEERKTAELDALEAIEEAEDEALAARKEREQELLDVRLERIDAEVEAERERHRTILDEAREQNQELIEEEKKNNRKLIDARKDMLRERQEGESEALTERHTKEKEALDNLREQAITAQEEQNKDKQDSLNTQQEMVLEQLEAEIDAVIANTPKSKAEFAEKNKELRGLLGRHNFQVELMSASSFGRIQEGYELRVKGTLRSLEQDKIWEDFARNTTRKGMRAIFGQPMNMTQVREWLFEGKLPKSAKATLKQGGAVRQGFRYGPEVAHSGGIVGSGVRNRTGKSGAGLSPTERIVIAEQGEGILKRTAMMRPGMREFLARANRGDSNAFIGDGEGMNMGALFTGVMRDNMGQLMQQTMLTGSERSLNMLGGTPTTGGKFSDVALDSEQTSNARLISQVGRAMGAQQRDIIIALMTAMQESSLRNLPGGDRDSVGLFQQRPSQGWGSVAQIMDPQYAARQFFDNLLNIKNRGGMELWEAAQAVQRSAFPYAYAKWEPMARSLVDTLGPGGANTLTTAQRWKNVLEGVQYYQQHSDMNLTGPGFAGRFSGAGLGWQRQWNMIKDRFPGSLLTSAYRPGAITSSGFPSYHGLGRAVDLVSTPQGMMDIFNWIRQTYGNRIHELYYSPAEMRQVRQGKAYRPGGITRAQHFDHVHWAMNEGGWVPGIGNKDTQHTVLTPKEHVTNAIDAQKYAPILNLINSGKLRMDSNLQNLGMRNVTGSVRSIDNQASIVYDIDVNVEAGANITEGQVRTIFNKISREQERFNGPARRNGR